MGAVWRRTAACAPRSRCRHVSRAWKSLRPAAPRWSWARLLKRVFDLDMATCPFCQRGALRIIAAITPEVVITRMLRHLKLAAVSPPIAPAHSRQETFDWVA